ncbi:hypothetical protein [Rhodovibrio sodomensis]|nr:hypothetical protein [Rhodovibrio sodomensis]
MDADQPDARVREFGQFPTPMWVAEAIVERHFPDLDADDHVIEPGCGPGSFLSAIPSHVPVTGYEIDADLAERARRSTGRRVVTGDFTRCPVDLRPTCVIGNPPFKADVIDAFLACSHALLPENGRVGFILPAYMFQTASRVARYAEDWSLFQEMIPRNVFRDLKAPIVFALFSKDRRRSLVGFALYREADEIRNLSVDARDALERGRGPVWRQVVSMALDALGGEANLDDIYAAIEGKRPTRSRHWREKVRQTLQRGHFRRIARGRWALPETA